MSDFLLFFALLAALAVGFLFCITGALRLLHLGGYLDYLKGEQGPTGFTGAMGAIGEPASALNVIGAISILYELDNTLHQHLDTYILDGAYWTYMDRTSVYEQYPDMVRSPDNKKFVVVGFVNGRSAENDYSIGDTYIPFYSY